jgi:hypothetical protein
VLSEQHEAAIELLESISIYRREDTPQAQWNSILDTFPQFQISEVDCFFYLWSSDFYRFDPGPATIERSHHGIPYPRTEPFAQSLLDTHRLSDLSDLIDGMDLSSQWGEDNLDLDEISSFEWAEDLNQKIRQLIPDLDKSAWYMYPTSSSNRRSNWNWITTTKRRRIGAELPAELMATKYRPLDFEEQFMKLREDF